MKKTITFLLTVLLSFAVLCGCTVVETKKTDETDDSTETADADWVNPYADINLDDYVTLGIYKDFTVTVEKEEVTDEILNYYATYYYAQSFTTEETDRTVVEQNDTVSIVYTPYVDGEAIEGDTDIEETLVIGYSQMIEGFEEALIGKSLNEDVVINLTFPEDYTTTEKYMYLNGKPVRFDVKITNIATTVIPTKDEFAEEEGYDSYQEYEDDLRASLQAYADSDYDSAFSDAVIGAIVNNCTKLEVPESVYNTYMSDYEETYSAYAAYYGDDYTWDTVFEDYYGTTPATYATNQIHRELVLFAVAEAENLSITEEFYDSEIEMLQDYLQSSYYTSYSEEDIIEMFGEDYLNYQFNLDYTLDWIEKTITNDAVTEN